jgi:hypothetical protein
MTVFTPLLHADAAFRGWCNQALRGGLGQLKQTARWMQQQPTTRWLNDEFVKAGDREYTAKQWLYHNLADLWAGIFGTTHTLTDAAVKAIPNHRVFAPLKQQLATLPNQLNSVSQGIRHNDVIKTIMGYTTFKGLWDMGFYTLGGKSLMIGAHLLPAAGAGWVASFLSPFALMAMLSGLTYGKAATRRATQKAANAKAALPSLSTFMGNSSNLTFKPGTYQLQAQLNNPKFFKPKYFK